MKHLSFNQALATIILALSILSASAFAEPTTETRKEHFSLKRNALALGGYDPVSYFQSGPVKGSKKIEMEHKGIRYRFVSEANRNAFNANPEKYEPQYGGWCAWAMYDGGGRTKANPKTYTIIDGKVYVFYKSIFVDTLQLWNEAIKESSEKHLITKADKYWNTQISEQTSLDHTPKR